MSVFTVRKRGKRRPDSIDRSNELSRSPLSQVLLDKKERLDRPYRAR